MSPREVSQKLLFYQPIRNPTVLMRRSIINKYNLRFDTNIAQACDYDFWARCRKFKHLITNDLVVKYYRHPGSDSSNVQKVKINHRLIVKRNLQQIGINASDKLVELISPYKCVPVPNQVNQYVQEMISFKGLFLKEISEYYFNEKLDKLRRKARGF